MSKSWPGNFFEDFALGQELRHPTPRTLTEGDRALCTALYGSRFALTSSDEFARACGLPRAPLDELAVFHIVFGKTVPQISQTRSRTSATPRDGFSRRAIPATR